MRLSVVSGVQGLSAIWIMGAQALAARA
jgi:hypothetical protein